MRYLYFLQLFCPLVAMQRKGHTMSMWSLPWYYQLMNPNFKHNLHFLLFLYPFKKRHEQERGDVVYTARLPDASAHRLPRRTLRHHDVMLEEQARRPAHLRLHAECSGRLLHRHRGPVPTSALGRETGREPKKGRERDWGGDRMRERVFKLLSQFISPVKLFWI